MRNTHGTRAREYPREHTRERAREGAFETSRLLLRLVLGLIFMAHGFLKLTDMSGTAAGFSSMGLPMPEVAAWGAALAEFLGGAAMFFGFLTRIAGLALSVVMVVAIATVHAKNGLMADKGGFEYPLVLLAASVHFMLGGAGHYSLDEAMRHLYTKHRDADRDHPGGSHGPAHPAES